MSEPTQEELRDSINELSSYYDRLKKEVITISKKLRMPAKKIDIILEDHKELKQIQDPIKKLKRQKELTR